MAEFKGTNGSVKLEATGTTPEVIINLTSWSVSSTQDVIETSATGQARTTAGTAGPKNTSGDSRQYIKGRKTWTGTAEFNYDSAAQTTSVGPMNIFTDTSDLADIQLFSDGDQTGDQLLEGQCIVTDHSIALTHDGLVTGTISYQGTGDLTVTTVS